MKRILVIDCERVRIGIQTHTMLNAGMHMTNSFLKTALVAGLVLSTCVFTAFGDELPKSDAGNRDVVNSPLSPRESLKYLKLAPGLRLELVAAEPQVIDPVAIAFDEAGRIWVVEMTDYPSGPKPGEAPRSRVRVLEDQDGDGRFETARTFVDHLLFATGLQLWKGGVFVTLAGKVMYFRDTTGDGRADVKETWFTGFAQMNEQLRANHPTLALDNRIYIANGLRNGIITGRPGKKGTPATAVSISGRDFRFDPLTDHYDAVTGSGQFGLTFDDFGNRFICTNRNPTKHIVLKRRYIDRNPLLSVPAATYDISPPASAATVFPLSRNWTHYSNHLGQITAACGLLVYRGDALPAEFARNVFVCEPPGNLIHRRILKADGATFQTRRAREGVEFLASPDDWFRPVNLTIGPDGALYVVDMYRAVVEHPHWLPEDLSRKLPLNAGNDRGRIYRIVSADSNAAASRAGNSTPQLSHASGQQLVKLLEHSNCWQHETAARLIYERQDKSVHRDLAKLVRHGQSAVSRVHALWALEGLGQLTMRDVQAAVADSDTRVREQGVVLSERWLDMSTELRQCVMKLSTDSDARLRFQVAMSLGQATPDSTINAVLQRIALHEEADSWTRSAVLSSIGGNSSQMLLAIIATITSAGRMPTEAERGLARDVAHLVGAHRKDREIRMTVAAAVSDGTDALRRRFQLTILTELARGLVWRNGSFAETLDAIVKENPSVGKQLIALLTDIAETAIDRKQEENYRCQCVELLRFVGYSRARDVLIRLVRSEDSQKLRLLAIDVVSAYDDPGIGRILLTGFQSQTPLIRSAVLDAMLSDPGRVRLLLAEFAASKIALSELNPTAVRRLVEHPNAEISKESRRLLADAIPANRQKVIAEYQEALKRAGEAARGRLVFTKNCAQCHRIGQIGVTVGPYIGDFTLKPNVRSNPPVILESILNPNRAIDSNYVSYTVVTNSGKIHIGIIAQETGTSVTLKQEKNKSLTILRDDIDAIRSNRTSLMPEGFEKNISVEQMADLIAFLCDWRFLDGLVPLDQAAKE